MDIGANTQYSGHFESWDQNINITGKPQSNLNIFSYQEMLLKGIFVQETEGCGLDYSASR